MFEIAPDYPNRNKRDQNPFFDKYYLLVWHSVRTWHCSVLLVVDVQDHLASIPKEPGPLTTTRVTVALSHLVI